MATKPLQPTTSEVLGHVANTPGTYVDLDEHVEVVLTNRKDNEVGVRIWTCARAVAARNRRPRRG